MSKDVALSFYKKLLTDIAALYEGARKALVEAYWGIGRHIVRVEQKGEFKAAYGSGLLQKLSEDLTRELGPGFSYTNLKNMRRFYLDSPNRQPAGELTRAQHIELLSVRDLKQRKALEVKAVDESLKRDEVRVLVRREVVREQVAENLKKRKSAKDRGETCEAVAEAELLTFPKDLRLGTYKKAMARAKEKGAEAVDCGFCVFREVRSAELKGVTVTEKPAYAYEAEVESVVDGDTIWAVIDVGFGTRVREKLRLRGIDCPELGSPEGEAAKRFVAKCLPVGARILIKTTSSDDKYGRYVADVFAGDLYLNNRLLEEGLAVRVKG